MIGLLAPKFAYGKDFQQQSNKPKQNHNSAITGNKLYKVKGEKKHFCGLQYWTIILMQGINEDKTFQT